MRGKIDEGSVSLFVYGTLRSGEPNHHLLSDASFSGAAGTEPAFELVDWGEYPALVTGGQTSVRGEVYAVSRPLLAAIDEFENHPTLYRRTRVRLNDGSEAEAYVVDDESVKSRHRIPSGDWVEYVRLRGSGRACEPGATSVGPLFCALGDVRDAESGVKK